MSPAISVGSVEVDVVPNAQGVRQRMQNQLVPAANEVGDEVGRVIGRYMTSHIANAFVQGVRNGGRQAQAPAARQGQSTGSTFARSFKARLEAALAALPEVRLRADSSDAEREIYQIRAQMRALADARIGIDVSTETANAAIARLQERLARLSASDADVAVRVDAGAAAAQLAAFQGEVNRLDGQTATVDVDTSTATASLGGLTAAAVAFGPALLPVLPAVAAGLGAVAAAAVAAGAGLGAVALVAIPAFKQIGGVLGAQKAAQDAATQSTAAGGAAAAQASSKALQLASAQQAVATAERNGARQIAQAEQAVTQARQNAAQVAAQASLRSQQAARAVEAAEDALADAQKAAAQAQKDLTAARAQAVQELQDLNNQLADSALSQRDAEIQLKEAAAQRDAVLNNANSSELDKQKALLAYDEAVQRLKEQTEQTKRLKTQTDAANKAGVEGTDTYKNAQAQLAQAQQAVADKTQALKDAQADQARTATQNAQEIAQAQQRIADAQANVAVAQQNAADASASAQRQLQQAQMSTAGGANAAAAAQAKYLRALAALTPSARATYFAFVDLRTAFGAWSKSLQPAVMPIFTRALVGLKNALPALTPFVLAAAAALKGLQDRAAAGFKSPWWQTFKKDLQTSVTPAITGLGVAFGHIFKGMAGIIDAFLPHMDSISGHLQRTTGKFAAWGAGLKGSPEFERFLSYSAEHAPLIAQAFGAIFTAFLNIGEAISPLSGPLLQVVTTLARGVGWLAQNVPGLVPVLYGLYVATKLWALWQLAVNGAMTAFNLISKAGPWGWIVLAVTAVVLAVLYAWKHFAGFRTAVLIIWAAIKDSSLYLWQKVLKPVFTAIGDIVVWLWTHIIKPYIGFVIAYWKTLATVALWLWKNILGPVFHAIADLVVWWWKSVLKPNFLAVRDALKAVGAVFKWLYDKSVKPVWEAIASTIASHFKYGIKPYFDALKSAVGQIVTAFKVAKDGIGKQWSKIRDLTKDPINFVIGTVWNKGIVSAWQKITGWIPGVPKLGKLPLLASGGTLPVQPGVFNSPTAIVGEGNPRHPEFVIPTDPRYRGRATALWQAAGTQLLAGGGIIGDIVGGVKSIGSSIGSAAGFLTHPGKALDKLFGKLLGPLQGIKGTSFGKLTLALPKAILKGLKSLITGSGAASGLGGDLGAHGASAKQAQQLARLLLSHYGWSQAQMPPLIKLWNGESGWRWNALNASSGAYGIPQALPASKMASAGADWHSNAGTQIKWGLGYIKSRYGSPANAWSTWQARSPHWYDEGGMLQPGLNLAYNGTGKPEPVFTSQQANALFSTGKQQAQQPVIVELHPQEGAFGHWVDVRIGEHDQQLVQVLNAG